MSIRSYILLAVAILNLVAQRGLIPGVQVEGPRHVEVYYETSQKTPLFNQMIVDFRSGAAEKHIAAKGTEVQFLDVTQDPQPDPTLALPSLYVGVGEVELFKTTITDVKPAAVLEVIKAHGG